MKDREFHSPHLTHPTQNNNNSEIATVDVAKFEFYFPAFSFVCFWRPHFRQWPEIDKTIIKSWKVESDWLKMGETL